MPQKRLRVVQGVALFIFSVIIARLFYWQVMSGSRLQAIAQIQHESTIELPASRGQILTRDGFPLVMNQSVYLTYLYTPTLNLSPFETSEKLAPFAVEWKEEEATLSAEIKAARISAQKDTLMSKISGNQTTWIPIKRLTYPVVKNQIETLGINGIGFEEYQIRHYPEASMAAQLVGFVGSDGTGKPKGYFGLEGFYDLELTGKSGVIRLEKDVNGRPISVGDYEGVAVREGRTLKTHVDRGLQLLVEESLAKGIEKYGALSGEVVIMEPKTGAIRALASLPKYDPARYKSADTSLYRIPAISDAYEPGSTFKVVVMAAGVDAGKVKADTQCFAECDGPVDIGKYTIRTWNDEYNPGTTMTEVLEHSDNTGMIFVANKLGQDLFIDYLKKFGFYDPTGIDLEGETTPVFRQKWGDIDLATGSFGQGLAVTSIQMVQAVGVIANQGKLMQPQVVDAVISEDGEVDIKPKVVRQVISKESARTLTEMMVESARHGEAQWAFLEGYRIAGKTGTAQIPVDGHYDKDKTMASFIGFAPADDPQFVMLVKLREPQSSQWASETAAPLWYNLARDIFSYYGIPPK